MKIAGFGAARRGSSMMGYALTVGLIAIIALAAISAAGSSVKQLFGKTSNILSGSNNQISAGSSAPETPPPPPADTTPDVFSISFSGTPAPGSAVVSNAFQITGVSEPVTASITGDDSPILQISANGTSGWTSLGSGLVPNGQYLRVSFTAAVTASGVARTGTVTVGSGSGVAYGVTTSSYTTCATAKAGGVSGDGVLTIDPDGSGGAAPFQTYCLMTQDGGGWTLMAQMIPSTNASLSLFNASAVGTLQLDSTSTAAPAKLADTTINAIKSTNEILIVYDHLGYTTTTRSFSQWDAICRFDMANTVSWNSTAKMLSSSAQMDSTTISCSRTYAGDGTYIGITASGTISGYGITADLDKGVSLYTTNTTHLVFSAATTYTYTNVCGSTYVAGRTWLGESTYGCNAAKWFIR